jgi:flagellar capping protein FliD
VISKSDKISLRYTPMAFTEQGVAMLSSVLKSKRAINVNIQIMRIFIKLRQMYLRHEDLKQKIIAIELKYDRQFKVVFEAIKQLMEKDKKPKQQMGYVKAPESNSDKKNQTIYLQ